MGLEGASFGPYRLARRLGGGGAGEVYLADLAQGAPAQGNPARVALKVIDGRPDDAEVRELVREAEVAAHLRNAHIIPYYGVIQTPASSALVMGYAPGGSLGDVLRAGDRITLPLPTGVVARIVIQVASALDAAHAAGLVHGDLKPTNLFVRTSSRGSPLAVVSDFGQSVLTRAAATLATSDTSTSQQVAWAGRQLRFAAPEQLRGAPQPASDQYGLAAVAYYLLTGRAPLTGEARSMPGLLESAPVPPPSRFNAALSGDADAFFLRALAKDPAARFPSVGAFAAALAESLAAPTASPGASVTEQMSAMSEPSAYGSPSMPLAPRERLRIGATGAGVALADGSSVILPEDAPRSIRRMLALGAGVAVLALIVTCLLSLFWSGGAFPQLPTALSGNTSTKAPTATATDAAGSAQARAAQQELANIVARTPVFSDTFASNNAHWATNSTASIHDGHLYLSNSAGQTPGLEQTPRAPRLASVAVQADVALTGSQPSDFAGICFFATTDAKGNPSYYCSLASADGRYELWNYYHQWQYVAGGYSSALRLGFNQVNTLAVIANAPQGVVTVFANGVYLTQIHVGANPSLSATEGLLVLNVGAQASFTNYAVYNAG